MLPEFLVSVNSLFDYSLFDGLQIYLITLAICPVSNIPSKAFG